MPAREYDLGSSPNRMRRSLLAVVAAVFLLTSSAMAADDLLYARFADYLDALRQQVGIPGLQVAVVGPTDVLWERGFGYQDVARALPMRPDTPIHVDGLTEIFAATSLMQCAENGRLRLDDPVGAYVDDAIEPEATFRHLLAHTSQVGTATVYAYRPERLNDLDGVLRRCEGASFRSSSAQLQNRLAMVNSVPGADVLSVLTPPEPGEPDEERTHYAGVLAKLAVPYIVDSQKRVQQTLYSATTLQPSTGLITTAHDYAQFDLALRSGLLMLPETLAEAWRPQVDPATGKLLPHGLGWFVQSYNGDPVIWQFGSGENGSSSMVITLPTRGLTLVMAANSTGLVKSFPLAKGDVTTSPFARTFLSLFTR